MRQIKLFFALLSFTALFGSCLRDSEIDQTPLGYLIYANAFTESQSVSYFFDSRYTNTQSYRGIDGAYVYVGNRVLVISDPITNTTLLDTNVRFEDQQLYHSFFYGTREEPKLLLAQFEAIDNLENQSGIRFFHLANELEGAPLTVQFVKDGEVIHEYTGREQETDSSIEIHKEYEAVESGTYTIRILDEDGDELVVRENEVFANKEHYTITLIGTPGNDTHPLYIGIAR